MAISETGRHEALGCLPHTYLLLAKPSHPLWSLGHAGPSAKAPELPPAWPTLALFDSEQLICPLSLSFLASKMGA